MAQNKVETLTSLSLSSYKVNYMINKLFVPGRFDTVEYPLTKKHQLRVNIIELAGGRYFAKISCAPLSFVDDPKLCIKNAVEHALNEHKLNVSFTDVGVGGVVGNEGRLGFVHRLLFKPAPSVHAYAVFKLPGESKLCIEDPRAGIFSFGEDKLQSVFNDEICCFAATALFYFSYKMLLDEAETLHESSKNMFKIIHACTQVKELIDAIDQKIGTTETDKLKIIDGFVDKIKAIENPLLGPAPAFSLHKH